MGSKVKRFHVERDSIEGDVDIRAGTISYDRLKNFMMGTVNVDPPSIGAGAATDVTATVTGLTTGHKVLVSCQGALEVGLVPQGARASAANTLAIRLYNPTAAAVDGTTKEWLYIAWIP